MYNVKLKYFYIKDKFVNTFSTPHINRTSDNYIKLYIKFNVSV